MWASEQPASAQTCNFSVTSMAFGAVNLTSGAAVDTTATLSASCTGLVLNTVMICPNFGGGTGGEGPGGDRFMASGGDALEYQLYSNAARTTIWGSNIWPYAQKPPKLTVALGLLGNGTGTWTIYGRIPAGQAAAASGSYLSSLSGGHVSFRVRYNNSGVSCNSNTGQTSASQPNLTVSASILPTCTVSTTDVDFGSKGVLSTVADAAGSVRVTCSTSAPWTIGLGVAGGETATTRTMSKGTEHVRYGLYKDTARLQPWGDTGGQLATGTGTGALQNIPVYGRVPVQTTPSAGNYADVVVVTITY